MHPGPETAAEAASGLLQAALAAIVESTPDAIVGKSLDGIVTSWNGGAERLFGWCANEMIGQPLHRLVPEDLRAQDEGILARLRQGEALRQFQTQRLTRDGQLIDVSVTASPIRNAAGRVTGAAEITRDITALRRHEREAERLTRLYAALSHVNQAIAWTSTREELLPKVCRALVEQGGLRMAWIGWNDPRTHRLVPLAAAGDETGYLQRLQIHTDDRPWSLGPSGQAFRCGQSVRNDLLGDEATAPWRAEFERAGLRACAAAPIRLAGEVCGVLTVYADQRDHFQDKELALLTEAANDLSFALDNFAREDARGQAEQVVRDEVAFSTAMLDSMPGVVYFYDTDGRFLRWNRNFERVSGRSAGEIAAMHPLDFFTPADRALVEQRIAEVFAQGEASVEADFLHRDGSTRPYLFTGRLVEFRGQRCLVGVGIDISQRRRAELALVDSRAHLVEAQRIAGIGSWSLDLRDNRLIWSDQTCHIFGVDQATKPRSYEAFMALVHPDDRDALQAAHQAALAGRAPLDNEHRIVLRDGSERVVHSLAALQRDTSGQAVMLSGTAHDITTRVRLQAERERRQRAEAADHIKSAFLATMSHELRTPLNSIIGFSGILLKGLPGPLNPEQSKQLGMVRSSARHLLALVNDVLDISKIESGQLVVARLPYDLRRSIDKVTALVTPQLQSKGLLLQVQVASGLAPALGDARRFEQILLNLLSNAIKFTERGEVVLSADALADTAPGAPMFQVRVADTGPGIRAQDLGELFQPFRQLDTGLARHHEGTGLGLAICQRLAALMGGAMGVASQWGHGSTFTVTLPLHPPEPA
jgi:PAS domain S-box-containing protein